MEISRTGVKILKHLKEKNEGYDLLDKDKSIKSSMSHFNEIKNLFPNQSYAKVIFEMKTLLDEKFIISNDTENSYSFPKSDKMNLFKFGLSGKGYAFLENRVYRCMSKYVPLTISILSISVAMASLLYNIFAI